MTVGRSTDLAELFSPASIAVVGASNREGAVGATLFRNVLSAGYRGVVYPVNPRWKSVSGVRCYPTVADLPEAPELGIIIVPAPEVTGMVRSLGERGTNGVIVVSAGFREVGGAGVAREEELIRTAREYRMSLVGPNCFGVINTDPALHLNATFSDSLPPRGNIAFVSQSGALCAGILRYGLAERIGFSRFVSVGNRAGVDENDLLASLADDEATRVVLLYIESLADGRRFLETAREVTERKPVVVIKSGRTAMGERAARSHTGSLAHSAQDRLFDALFQQSGVLRVESIGDLFRTAKIFASGLKLESPRLAILTNSGGPGIVAADACARHGLELPLPSPSVVAALKDRLSPSSSIANPVDMTADADPDRYRTALRALLAAPEYGGALVIATPTGTMTGLSVAEAIVEVRRGAHKPITACLFGLTDLSREVRLLEESGVPAFTFPEEAVAALGSLARYRGWTNRPRTEVRQFPVDRPKVAGILEAARREEATVLPAFAARGILEAYGIAFPPSRTVRTLEGAIESAKEVGFPLALKVASPDISHKTDVGGVALGIESPSELRAAWNTMASSLAQRAPTARIVGFEVEAMVRDGKEVIVGVQRDPAFGPIVVFGLGGIYVEVLQDVTFRLAPLRTSSAEKMVEAVRGFPLLQGVRGEPPGDLPALYEVLERVSQLAVELEDVAELDLNPMIVRPAGKGVVAVDARVVLGPASRSGPPPSAARSARAPRRTPRRGAPRRRRR